MSEIKTKKKKGKIILALIILIAVVIIGAVLLAVYLINRPKYYNSKYNYDGKSLQGKWIAEEDFSEEGYIVYDFSAYDQEASEQGGNVTSQYLIYGIVAINDDRSTYRVEGKNKLIIYYYEGKSLVKNEYGFSISDNKKQLVLMDGTKEILLRKYDLTYNEDENIFGTWTDTSDDTVTYQFKEDYTGLFTSGEDHNDIVFSTKEGKIYMFVNESLSIEGYTLSPEFIRICDYSIDETGLLSLKVGEKTFYARKN